MMRRTISFDQFKTETCDLGLFWFDQEKTCPIPNLSTAISQSETNQCKNCAALLKRVLILKKESFLKTSVLC